MVGKRSGVLTTLLSGALLVSCGGSSVRAQDPEIFNEIEYLKETTLGHEELISACMRAEGFEYIAAIPRDLLLEIDSMIAATEGAESDMSPDDLPTDPNTAIVVALSDRDRDAYEFAYWGNVDLGGEKTGCYLETFEEAWSADLGDFVVTDEASSAISNIQFDPRIVQAADAYVVCMRAEGHDEVVDTDSFIRLQSERMTSLQARASSDKVSVEELPDYDSYVSWQEAVGKAHQDCIQQYWDTENEIRAEILENQGS